MRRAVFSRTFQIGEREHEFEAAAIFSLNRWALALSAQFECLPTVDRMRYVRVELKVGPIMLSVYFDGYDIPKDDWGDL